MQKLEVASACCILNWPIRCRRRTASLCSPRRSAPAAATAWAGPRRPPPHGPARRSARPVPPEIRIHGSGRIGSGVGRQALPIQQPQALDRLQARHPWHVQVEQQQVDFLPADHVEGLFAVGGLERLKAAVRQRPATVSRKSRSSSVIRSRGVIRRIGMTEESKNRRTEEPNWQADRNQIPWMQPQCRELVCAGGSSRNLLLELYFYQTL